MKARWITKEKEEKQNSEVKKFLSTIFHIYFRKAYTILVKCEFLLPVDGERRDGEAAEEDSSKMVKESSPSSENPDQDVIAEALKSICNILLHNETGQVSVLCS